VVEWKRPNVLNRYEKYLNKLKAEGKNIPGFKYVKPELGNMYTGIKPTKLAAGLVIGTALAYAVGQSAWNTANRGRDKSMASATDTGNFAGMSYDAVGNISNGQRDLGATGDLVFALHKARRG